MKRELVFLCPQGQFLRPRQHNGHEPANFLLRTLGDGHFNDSFIVDIERHGIAVLFERHQEETPIPETITAGLRPALD